MTRLILMAGLGGAGTTTLVGAAADAARSAGMRVEVVDASGTASVLGAPLRDLVSATVGAMAVASGADRLPPEAWASLPPARLLAALDELRRAALEADLVLVDAGTLTALRDLLALPHTLVQLLDASLTPRTAMARPGSGSEPLFEALSEARLQVLHLVALMTSPEASVRLVGRPTEDAAEPLALAAGTAALLGVTVDGIVLHRYPRRKDGASERARSRARAVEAAVRRAVPDVPVWRSSDRPRPVPKGRAVQELLCATNAVAADDEPTPSGDGFQWRVRVPAVVTDRVRAGTQGGSLVLEFAGVHRWLELPAVLKRCVAVDGERTASGITVTWAPDASVWPASAREESRGTLHEEDGTDG